MKEYKPIRAIISGGGTGGHIFPALAIAQALKTANPSTKILFVGAEGRMEMEKVPAAGFEIKGLPIAGLQRKLTLSNLALPFKLLKSEKMASRIIEEFRPDIAIGVGGYASAPLLRSACRRHIPTLIQEQNGYAGLTNKILGKKADKICVAYSGMEKFFPAEKIVMTGNPIRKDICPATEALRAEAMEFYGLNPEKKHILVVGGSLGSRTLNESMKKWICLGSPGGADVEILWQCGKYYKPEIDAFMGTDGDPVADRIKHFDFIKRMDLAYAAADVVISRSGASSISELCAAGKAVIFVPSPNVAENHQWHNAMALVKEDAAEIVSDDEAPQKLMKLACGLIKDAEKIERMEKNILKLARRDAAERIVEEIYKLV